MSCCCPYCMSELDINRIKILYKRLKMSQSAETESIFGSE